jgi:hypothetical protein
MNNEKLLDIIGWECTPSGNRSILATSPLTMGEDGQHVSFYIANPDDNSYYITDACNSAMYASSLGVELTNNRLNILNSTFGVKNAKFNSGFEIIAECTNENLHDALWDAVKLAMSISFNTKEWLPKFNQIRFNNMVASILTEVAGKDNLLKSYKATGISGHEVKFPLAVRTDRRVCIIEPIAILETKKIDWSHVYKTVGKMIDVKQSDTINKRIVVLEDGASPSDFGKASTILSQSATVRTLGTAQSWINTLAA